MRFKSPIQERKLLIQSIFVGSGTSMLVDIGECRLNVVEAGSGPAVIFLHCNTYSWRLWEYQLDSLSGDFRCIAVDLRGYGDSDRIGPLTVEQYAEDLEALRAVLKLERVSVVGMSLGGLVAQLFAIRYPNRVDKLVLANTTSGNDPEIADRVRQSARMVRERGLGPLWESGFDATFSPGFRDGRPDVVRRVRREFESTDPLTVAATAESLADHNHEGELKQITARTLVMHGMRDQMMRSEVSDTLTALIPDARRHDLDAGHLSNLEVPDEFTRVVADFLNERGD